MSTFMLSMSLVLGSLPGVSSVGRGVESFGPTLVAAASSAQAAEPNDDGDFDDIGPYLDLEEAIGECKAWRAHGSEANVIKKSDGFYVRVTRQEEHE